MAVSRLEPGTSWFRVVHLTTELVLLLDIMVAKDLQQMKFVILVLFLNLVSHFLLRSILYVNRVSTTYRSYRFWHCQICGYWLWLMFQDLSVTFGFGCTKLGTWNENVQNKSFIIIYYMWICQNSASFV